MKIIISEEISNILSICIKSNGYFNSLKFKLYKTKECEEILKKYDINSKELFYLWKNNITEIPTCKICGNKIKNFYREQTYCSNKCINNDKELNNIKQNNAKKICTEKYNTTYFMNTKEFKEKSKITQIKKEKQLDLFLKKLSYTEYELLSTEKEFCYNSVYTFKHKKCNKVFTSSSLSIEDLYCPYCIHQLSYKDEIIHFIQSVYKNNFIVRDYDIIFPTEDITIALDYSLLETNNRIVYISEEIWIKNVLKMY